MNRTLRKTKPGRRRPGDARVRRVSLGWRSRGAGTADRQRQGARTHLCDAVVDYAVGHVFPHDALDALQLLLLQRGAEACALWGRRRAAAPRARARIDSATKHVPRARPRGCWPDLKLVQLVVVEDAILVKVAQLENALECLGALGLEVLWFDAKGAM